ncbi:tetratricopeptide repeat protein [Bacillaceae bacterium SIJ1]|uniref:tetratricopeptide repeat protein n=1 Tax=Litoribacterium kuwaitense TaxID=1398745 RepID=UPI0013ECDC76|nr:tetratricopeptide repeat protein [Litoribacterium kuwaitense]NGP45329.1 tetratricopeptide repeat protein [Litoribacterium kuwaitense]
MSNQVWDGTKNESYPSSKSVASVYPFDLSSEQLFDMATRALKHSMFQKAEKLLKRAIAKSPDDAFYQSQLGLCLAESGQYEKSNEWLIPLLKRDEEGMGEAYFLVANNFAHLGRFDDAVYYTKKYLQAEPNGDFYEEAQDLIAVMSDDWLEDEDSILMMQEEAKDWLAKGLFEKAEQQFKHIIQMQPTFWAAHNNLALAYFYQGSIAKAFRTLNDVLEQSPGNLHAICNFAVFYHYMGNKEKRASVVAKLRNVYPLLPDVQYKLGATFAILGEHEAGFRKLYPLYRSSYPCDVTFFYWFSLCAFHTGRTSLAQKVWSHASRADEVLDQEPPWLRPTLSAFGGDGTVQESIIGLFSVDSPAKQLYSIYLLAKVNQLEETDLDRYPLHSTAKEIANRILNKNDQQKNALFFEVAQYLETSCADNEAQWRELLTKWCDWYTEIVKAELSGQTGAAWAAAIHVTSETTLTAEEACTLYHSRPEALKSVLQWMSEVKKTELSKQKNRRLPKDLL